MVAARAGTGLRPPAWPALTAGSPLMPTTAVPATAATTCGQRPGLPGRSDEFRTQPDSLFIHGCTGIAFLVSESGRTPRRPRPCGSSYNAHSELGSLI